jgi:ankyrin repeat protein
VELVKVLLAAGCDTNAQNKNGDTPLLVAVASGERGMVYASATRSSGITTLIAIVI